MKKILFATTALVATAGVAAADVSFGGYGRFGVAYTSTGAGTTSMSTRFRLTVDGTAESDSGLSFGARVRIEQDNGGVGTGINGARFFVSTGGLTVAVGNVYGAFDSLPGIYAGTVGMTGLSYSNVVISGAHGYNSKTVGLVDGVELIYSADSYSAHLSHGGTRTEIAGTFSFGDWTIGAGFADDTAAGSEWVVTAGGQIGSINVGVAVADGGANTNVILSGGFSIGAATKINVYAGQVGGSDNYGVGVVHSLGGGTSIQGGVAAVGGTTLADLGVVFNF